MDKQLPEDPTDPKPVLHPLETVKSSELEALVVNGLAYLKQGNPLAAYRRAERAARIAPDLAELKLLKARCLEAMGAPNEALAAYRQALKKSPKLLPAIRGLLGLSRAGLAFPVQTLVNLVHGLLQASDADADILLGSTLLWEQTGQLIGSCRTHAGTVAGWVVAQPDQPVLLGLKDDDRPVGGIALDPRRATEPTELLLVRRFTFDWPPTAASLSVFYQGKVLLNSPLTREKPGRPADNRAEKRPLLPATTQATSNSPTAPTNTSPRPTQPTAATRATPASDPCVDIIIPVYKNLALTQSCIASVLAAKNHSAYEIVVVDDATPEPELHHWLDRLAEQKRITLLRNPKNMGFILAVNRGISLHPERDVVLLNADTQVAGDWLDRLRATAYREANVASVTPFSNNGEHFGFPVPFKTSPMPQGASLALLQRAAAQANDQKCCEVPFGIGFCLYLRRACLEQTGYLDEAELTRGYGEEVDLCLRASAAGWQHRCALDTFVAHKGNVSFGEEKAALVESNNRLIRSRHPHARRLYRDFIAADPLHSYRQAIEKALIAQNRQSSTLVVIDSQDHDGAHWRAQWAAYATQPQATLFLQPCEHEAGNYRLIGIAGDSPKNLRYELPSALPELVGDLLELKVERIHYHDTASQRPEILELPAHLDRPYEIHPRDYALYCQRRYLHDESGRYCGDPLDPNQCASCIDRHASLLAHPIAFEPYRRQMSRFVGASERITVANGKAAQRFEKRYPGAQIEVHTPRALPVKTPAGGASGPWQLALLGPLNAQNGYRRLLRMARQLASQDSAIEIIIIGSTLNDHPLLATGKVWVSGKLAPEENAAQLARRLGANAALYAPAWPEADDALLGQTQGLGLPMLVWPCCEGQTFTLQTTPRYLPVEATPADWIDQTRQLLALAKPATN